jgi:hypothetical protein
LERTDGAGSFQIKTQLNSGLNLIDVLASWPDRPGKAPLQLSRWDHQMGVNRQIKGLKQEMNVSSKDGSRHFFGRHQELSAPEKYANSRIQAMR